MSEPPTITGIPAVSIIRGNKTLDASGCLVKCNHNGKTRLYFKTCTDLIKCYSRASYYGVLQLQNEGCTPTREVEFKVKKQIIESDGETASYCVKLDKHMKKELLQLVPLENGIFFSKQALHVITHKNEIIKAAVDNIDCKAIQLKQSRVPKSLTKGCPIYDSDMRVVGLLKDKKLGDIWNVSWFRQSNDAGKTFISRMTRRTLIIQWLHKSHSTPIDAENLHIYDAPYEKEDSEEPPDLHESKTETYEDVGKEVPVESMQSKRDQRKTLENDKEADNLNYTIYDDTCEPEQEVDNTLPVESKQSKREQKKSENDKKFDSLDDTMEEDVYETFDMQEKAVMPPPIPPRMPIPAIRKKVRSKQAKPELQIKGNAMYNIPPQRSRLLDDSEMKKPDPEHPRSQNETSIPCPSVQNNCSNPCSNLHQGHQCSSSFLQTCQCSCQGHRNRCCLLDQRCQHICPWIQLIQLHQCPSVFHSLNLVAPVANSGSEQCRNCMADRSNENTCNDGKNSFERTVPEDLYANKTSDFYQPLENGSGCVGYEPLAENASRSMEDVDCFPITGQNRLSRKSKKRRKKERRRKLKTSATDCPKAKCVSQERRMNEYADSGENTQAVLRKERKHLKKRKGSPWDNIDKDLTIESMNLEVRRTLAIEIDAKDWQDLARELQVPDKVIRDISFGGHFPSVDFLKHLLTKYPEERLIDFRDKVKGIERNDVIEVIDSKLESFIYTRLDELPKDKLEEIMKCLGEKVTRITKDWKNIALLYDCKDEEIDYIDISHHGKESPTDCLIEYLAKSNPSLSVAKIGRALEKLCLNRASKKLSNEYIM